VRRNEPAPCIGRLLKWRVIDEAVRYLGYDVRDLIAIGVAQKAAVPAARDINESARCIETGPAGSSLIVNRCHLRGLLFFSNEPSPFWARGIRARLVRMN
jgi:hypothetical protein